MDYLPGQYQLNTMCNLHFGISNIRHYGSSWVNEEVLVRVCDDGGDRYRFGFNGQEKVNEIAGMGNHNTAEFWEYDTRLGRRWNLDPVVKPNISNYIVLSNNPVIMIDPNGADDYYNKKGKFLGSDGIGTAVRLMDIDELQDKKAFEAFMNATKKGKVDIVKMRKSISRAIIFKNDGKIYEKMYSDSRDNAERSASIVLDPINAEVYVTDVQQGGEGTNEAPFKPSGSTIRGLLVLANIHTHQQEENYMEFTDMQHFESQYQEDYSDGKRAESSQIHIYSIGRDNINYYSPEGKEKSSNNVGSRRALDSGKLNIGQHALEKYGKYEKK